MIWCSWPRMRRNKEKVGASRGFICPRLARDRHDKTAVRFQVRNFFASPGRHFRKFQKPELLDIKSKDLTAVCVSIERFPRIQLQLIVYHLMVLGLGIPASCTMPEPGLGQTVVTCNPSRLSNQTDFSVDSPVRGLPLRFLRPPSSLLCERQQCCLLWRDFLWVLG